MTGKTLVPLSYRDSDGKNTCKFEHMCCRSIPVSGSEIVFLRLGLDKRWSIIDNRSELSHLQHISAKRLVNSTILSKEINVLEITERVWNSHRYFCYQGKEEIDPNRGYWYCNVILIWYDLVACAIRLDSLAQTVKLSSPHFSLVHCIYIIVYSLQSKYLVLVAAVLVLYLNITGLIIYFSVYQIEFSFISISYSKIYLSSNKFSPKMVLPKRRKTCSWGF